MLKKLLKYDFNSMLRYWWIGALASVALSLVGGWCISVMNSSKELPEILYVVSGILIFIVSMGFAVFSMLGTVLIFIRFYKNFFSDEGYLTFTLPVKRSSLLNSKLISSSVITLLSGIILLFDGALMMLIGLFYKGIFEDIVLVIREFIQDIYAAQAMGLFISMVIEVIVFIVLMTVFSHLFMFNCITIASIITKKAKVITSIAIYYGATSVFSFVSMLLMIFCVPTIGYWFSNIDYDQMLDVIPIIGLVVLLAMGVLCAMLYAFQYWLMDKKLNLS